MSRAFAEIQILKDPPVKTGGEGPNGHDWLDFPGLTEFDYRRSDQNSVIQNPAIVIASGNPNFELSHCRNTAGTSKIQHTHVYGDYGQNFGAPHGVVQEQEGIDFYDWAYENYSPKPVGGDSPTMKKNCVNLAYHEFKSGSTKSSFNVNPADAGPYRTELVTIIGKGDRGDFDTRSADRCDDEVDHVWIVEDSCDERPARCIVWKNRSSGVYTWFHEEEDETNDAPTGDNGTALYESYGIYNTQAR